MEHRRVSVGRKKTQLILSVSFDLKIEGKLVSQSIGERIIVLSHNRSVSNEVPLLTALLEVPGIKFGSATDHSEFPLKITNVNCESFLIRSEVFNSKVEPILVPFGVGVDGHVKVILLYPHF